ncbi:hypothetical protein GQ600_5107 [Phytophthora cactorum]|nr:hypothetical protein GQ600_5107 [Phytophthora cactorum]
MTGKSRRNNTATNTNAAPSEGSAPETRVRDGQASANGMPMTPPTPYQRMAQLLASRALREMSKHEKSLPWKVNFIRFVTVGKDSNTKIKIRMKHLWVSEHTFSQWRLVRLHFVDAEAPEPLEDMLSVFHANYDANRQSVDSLLLTVTIWNLENDPKLLPPPGCIVTLTTTPTCSSFGTHNAS